MKGSGKGRLSEIPTGFFGAVKRTLKGPLVRFSQSFTFTELALSCAGLARSLLSLFCLKRFMLLGCLWNEKDHPALAAPNGAEARRNSRGAQESCAVRSTKSGGQPT